MYKSSEEELEDLINEVYSDGVVRDWECAQRHKKNVKELVKRIKRRKK